MKFKCPRCSKENFFLHGTGFWRFHPGRNHHHHFPNVMIGLSFVDVSRWVDMTWNLLSVEL